jgi:molybdopterin-binding protein
VLDSLYFSTYRIVVRCVRSIIQVIRVLSPSDNMKTSARNQFPGEVVSVETDKLGAVVKVKVTVPVTVTSFITRESVEDMNIKKGDKVMAVVKSTEVMISKGS